MLYSLLHSILPFAGVMIFLVVVHELGHFFTAKASGVKVLEFGIGYPPKAWGFRRGETEYTINWLPLGGFVRMLGEEDPSDPRSLAAKKPWIRLIVLLSGAGMNALLPFFLYIITFLIPQPVPLARAVVDKVNPGSPAAEAGVKTGDVIVAINGHEIDSYTDVSYYICRNQGSTMQWTVRRPITGGGGGISAGSETVTLNVYARRIPPVNQGRTGISLAPRGSQSETRGYGLFEALPRAGCATIELALQVRNQIASIVGGERPQLSGPVGIAQATGEVVKKAGWVALIELAAVLSVNLAVINVLPLPMLDGGRVVFVLIEMLRGGKRVPPEKEALVHLAGFVLLISLVVVISYFDVLRIINGDSIFR